MELTEINHAISKDVCFAYVSKKNETHPVTKHNQITNNSQARFTQHIRLLSKDTNVNKDKIDNIHQKDKTIQERENEHTQQVHDNDTDIVNLIKDASSLKVSRIEINGIAAKFFKVLAMIVLIIVWKV